MPNARTRKPTRRSAGRNKQPDLSRQTIARKPLAREVLRVIAEKNLSQVAAGILVGEQQSQISLVSSGHLAGFSPERLIRMLTRLGREVDVVIRPKKGKAAGKVRIIVGRARG
jgi:predicted XRE-type DNA-binding protein